VKIKAYHGSDHEITKFSDEFVSGPNAKDAEGPGIYITNSKDNAAMWGKYTYELILSPRKFITNQKPSSKANRIDMKKFLDMKGDEDYANNWNPDIETDKLMAINEAIKYNSTEDEAWHSLRREQYNGVPQAFMRAMSKLGYDMMTLKKDFDFKDVDTTYHYIVYNPEIIEIVGVERNSIEENAKKAVRKVIKEVIEGKLLSSEKRMKAILRSKEAYQILDDSKAPGTTWTAGGCGILALALSEHFSAPIWAVYNTTNKHVEHFVVKVENGNFLDADGEHRDMIRDFLQNEIVNGELKLVPYDKSLDIGDIVMDETAARKLVELFKEKSL